MTTNEFLEKLQGHAASFAKAVVAKEGEWSIRGFIDVYRRRNIPCPHHVKGPGDEAHSHES